MANDRPEDGRPEERPAAEPLPPERVDASPDVSRVKVPDDTPAFSVDAVMAEAEKDEAAAEARRMVVEAEAGGRDARGLMKWVIFALAIGWSLFQLGIAGYFVMDAFRARAIHLTFAIVLTFLVFPGRRRGGARRIPWYDYIAAVVAGASVLYLAVDYVGIQTRFGIPIGREIVLGWTMIVLLLEATRRSLGPALAVIAGLFLVYAMIGPRGALPFLGLPDLLAHRGYAPERLISQMYVTTEGIFGIALGVSVQFVFLFVLFGSMLDRAGAGKYFIDLANAFLGTSRGGPAKAAVVASGMTGMVSGSSLANVVTTGTFTIPLMKRAGYPAHKAAGIEVAVSTNGQLMPPVMGAAAFIIAEFTGTAYFEVIRAAFVPAVISFIALFYIVHLEALKLGLKGMTRDQLPSRLRTFVEGIHYLVPLAILIYYLVIVRATPAFAVLWAIAAMVVLMLVQAPIRARLRGEPVAPAVIKGVRDVIAGLEAGARNMVGIAVAVATAGIVVGTVNLTGLGLRLTEIIQTLARAIASFFAIFVLPVVELFQGNTTAAENAMIFAVVLLITAIASLILGLGLPTTANYIVMATLTAPVIYTLGQQFGFGVPLLAAHLFVFFFGILADDTPPVGLAAFAAAAIARSDPIRTGIQGFTYDMRTAILPFMFIFNTRLLLFGVDSFLEGAWVFLSALLGMLAFGAATQGFVVARTTWYERLVLLGVAFALIQPNWVTDVVGLALVLSVIALQHWRLRRRAAPEGAS
jgi:TRAP transporter 4TM/12TM fusion protein